MMLIFVKIPLARPKDRVTKLRAHLPRPSNGIRKRNRKRAGSLRAFRISTSYLFAERKFSMWKWRNGQPVNINRLPASRFSREKVAAGDIFYLDSS